MAATRAAGSSTSSSQRRSGVSQQPAQHAADLQASASAVALTAAWLRVVLLSISLPADKSVLDEVIDVCALSRLDRRLTRPLLLVQLYDLLFGSQREIEGGGHWKRLILSQRTPIAAALARIYIRTGAAQPQQLLPHALRPRPPHPRYVRVNTLLTSLPDAIAALTAAPSGFTLLPAPTAVFPFAACFYLDADVPNLLVFPPGTAFYSHLLYLRHHLVLQDKASCLPALCLDPQPGDVVVDGCAAPGNKTSHLLAIMQERADTEAEDGSGGCSVDAFEVDNRRFDLLCEMMRRKGAEVSADCAAGCHSEQQKEAAPAGGNQRPRARVRCHHASFLNLRSSDSLGQRCSHLLLDPTCSGSGMMNSIDAHYKQQAKDDDREQQLNGPQKRKHTATLRDSSSASTSSHVSGRKRRHRQRGVEDDGREVRAEEEKAEERPADTEAEEAEDSSGSSAQSVSALSEFQLSLLLHAFSLPALRRVVYSTCSTDERENEQVIARALRQHGRQQGWEVMTGLMPQWRRRGRQVDGLTAEEAQAMLRCEADDDLMNGFFVCGLRRRSSDTAAAEQGSAEQSSGGGQEAEVATAERAQATTKSKRKRKKKKRKQSAAQPAVDVSSAAAV